jgi:hypothetical protein
MAVGTIETSSAVNHDALGTASEARLTAPPLWQAIVFAAPSRRFSKESEARCPTVKLPVPQADAAPVSAGLPLIRTVCPRWISSPELMSGLVPSLRT